MPRLTDVPESSFLNLSTRVESVDFLSRREKDKVGTDCGGVVELEEVETDSSFDAS